MKKEQVFSFKNRIWVKKEQDSGGNRAGFRRKNIQDLEKSRISVREWTAAGAKRRFDFIFRKGGDQA